MGSLGAGLLLLLPRQWVAAGMGFGFAMLFHMVARRRPR
jgi:hypothetical protein